MGTIIIVINSPGQYHWSYLFPKYLISLDPLSPPASVHTSPWSLTLGLSSETSDWNSHKQIHGKTGVTTAALSTLWWIYLYSTGFHWDRVRGKRRAAGGGLMEWGSYCLVDRADNCPEWFSLAAGKGGLSWCLPSCCGFCCSLSLLLSPVPWWHPLPHPCCCCHWLSICPLSVPAAFTVVLPSSLPCAAGLLSWPVRHLWLSHLGVVKLSCCYSGERIFPCLCS